MPVQIIKKSEKEWRSILGKVLSNEGVNRRVFEHKFCPGLVVKKARKKCSYISNIMEFETWNLAKANGLSEWLAECVEISDSGRYLIQVRGEEIVEEEMLLSNLIPSWLNWDLENRLQWVKINGRVVVCDYGHNQATELKAELSRSSEVSLTNNGSFEVLFDEIKK